MSQYWYFKGLLREGIARGTAALSLATEPTEDRAKCLICTAVLFVVSMMTPPPPREKTEGLTFGGAPVTAGETRDERKFEVGLSVLLVALLGVLWIVFA